MRGVVLVGLVAGFLLAVFQAGLQPLHLLGQRGHRATLLCDLVLLGGHLGARGVLLCR